ncbi:MAG TPA: DUF5667 domain-containing protein, partial [Candidatus Limnocylindria bacterium]|nr:DUF5667 domain-containing protein [Candidatus Limnocylindria bacterium]
MADGDRHDFTEELEAVARGVRRLDDIKDPVLRDAVRAALGLRSGTPGLRGSSRARMRRAVVDAAPRGPRPSDRLYAGLALLAVPTPYLLRAVAVALVAGALLAGTTVTSADALPDEPLYFVKTAAEDLRLALAATNEDRAAVELSLAEHRLIEAERLAEAGRESATLVAASAYGSHLARAAAELAVADVISPRAASLIEQLGARLAELRDRAAARARLLMEDDRTALAGVVLAQVATAGDAGGTGGSAQRIAEGASSIATRLAELAAERAEGGQPLTDAFEEAERSLAALEETAGDADDETAADDGPAPAAPTPTPAPARAAMPTARTLATPTRAPASTQRAAAVGSVAFPAATPKRAVKPTPTRRPSPTVDPSARIAAER